MKNFTKKDRIYFIAIFCFLAISIFVFVVSLPQTRLAQALITCPSGSTCQNITGFSDDALSAIECDVSDNCDASGGVCCHPRTEAGGTATTPTPSEKPPPQQLVNPIGGTEENPTGVATVPTLISNIIKAVLGIVGAVALFMFVWGGFTWLTSGGNPDKIKTGKDVLVWATIGLLVIFASYTLVETIFKALGAIP